MSKHLQLLLRQRDSKEKAPFENLIYTINQYSSELESTLILVDSMKASLKRARPFQATEDVNSPSGNQEIFESKIKDLKEERADLYKQQSQQATQMLALNDQLRSKDTVIATLTNQISALKTEHAQNKDEFQRMKDKVKEKDEAVKHISDELVTLQLELLRLDQWQEKDKQPESNIDNGSTISLNNPISFIAKKLKIIKEKEITAPHQYPLSSFTSKAASRQLLTGSEDQKIILYDLTRISTKAVLKWQKMNGPIVSLAIDESGCFVASCSAYDHEVTIWSLGSGKIQNTLQFSVDEEYTTPLLKFGSQFRLWMCTGRTVRLWDIQRGLLLRTWKRDVITSSITKIAPDAKRPDRLWCFDQKGRYSVINAVNGRIQSEWKALKLSENDADDEVEVNLSTSKEHLLIACRNYIYGYKMNSSSIDLDCIFTFDLSSLEVEDENGINLAIKSISIHPERSDLFGVLLQDSRVLVVQVSADHWKPEYKWIDKSEDLCDGMRWGPEEIDPITGEIGSKLVLLAKESKKLQLYTITGSTKIKEAPVK